MLEPGTWQADMDVGEMLYNFMLDRSLRSACGVDVQPYLGGGSRTRVAWMCWSRCVMGLKPSPYGCVRMQALARVSKIVSASGKIAGDLGTYVDDLRPVGSSERHCVAVAHRISTLLCYLGIQDALRKRTEPSL
jgi:hypothetical protein